MLAVIHVQISLSSRVYLFDETLVPLKSIQEH